MRTKEQLITVSLLELRGKDIAGVRAQVTNPMYLNMKHNVGSPECWRVLTHIKEYVQSGMDFIELYWERESGDVCNFTGCSVRSDICRVQFTASEWNKIK